MSELRCYFDGCCEPKNPGGHAACGAAIFDGETLLFEKSGWIGEGPAMSNNVAEYSGAIAILRWLVKHPDYRAAIYGDSKLVINQLQGNWRVNPGLHYEYYKAAKALFDQVRDRVTLEWIPRDQNDVCDHLSKEVLRRKGIRFRIQPDKAGN